MAIPAYMTIDGVEGSVEVAGREGTIEILQFDHTVYMPIDRDDGTISGTRKHGAITIHKAFDKSSAELYKRVCTGETIPSIEIKWYQITPSGEEDAYFFHNLDECKISSVRSYMHNVKDPTKETFVHQEEVCIRYEKIKWRVLPGNHEHTDTWNIRT